MNMRPAIEDSDQPARVQIRCEEDNFNKGYMHGGWGLGLAENWQIEVVNS